MLRKEIQFFIRKLKNERPGGRLVV